MAELCAPGGSRLQGQGIEGRRSLTPSIVSLLRGSYDEVVALQCPYDPAKMTVRGPVFPTRRDER